MDEQFDDELKKRIREVFDNFEDTSADEGWLELRKKYPEEKANRRAIAWIWWAAAAMLFLFLGGGLWIFNKNDQSVKFTVKHSKHPQSENLAVVKSHGDTNVKIRSTHTANPTNIIANNTGPAVIHKKTSPIVKAPLILNDTAGKKVYLAKTADKKSANKSSVQQLAATNQASNSNLRIIVAKPNPPVNKSPGKQLAANNKVNNSNPGIVAAKPNPPVNNSPGQQLAATNQASNSNPGAVVVTPNQPVNKSPDQQLATTNQATNSNPGVVIAKPKQPAKSMADMFAEEQALKTKKTDKSKTVNFGVYAGTYFNYAKGSNNQVNAGMGVTADIKITDNLKLVTGITVAQNSLNFATAVPTSSAQTSFGALSAASTPSEYSIKSLVTEASVPAFKNYDASLVGLDIPVNLKYEFNPKKIDVYVLAGLSSGTFINETYTYQYNYPVLASASLQQIQDETSRKSFNGFYFAKTLNLAFGVGYPLGKNHIVLEPFLKYPLDGLGSQNIRFGAGGLNLKFNFQTPKK